MDKGLRKIIWFSLLDFFFPSVCRICNGPLNGAKWVCCECMERIITTSPPYCDLCGFPLPPSFSNTTRPLCKDCRKRTPHFYKARSVAIYDGVMRECIHLLKYEKKMALSRPLGKMMADLIKGYISKEEFDLIVPVPLHHKKKKERGFNQAELLSNEVGKTVGVPVNAKDLIKHRSTPSQTDLSKKQRITNVKNSFRIRQKDPFFYKRILLIDDVFTTGATINECSKVLLLADAKSVFALTLARNV